MARLTVGCSHPALSPYTSRSTTIVEIHPLRVRKVSHWNCTRSLRDSTIVNHDRLRDGSVTQSRIVCETARSNSGRLRGEPQPLALAREGWRRKDTTPLSYPTGKIWPQRDGSVRDTALPPTARPHVRTRDGTVGGYILAGRPCNSVARRLPRVSLVVCETAQPRRCVTARRCH